MNVMLKGAPVEVNIVGEDAVGLYRELLVEGLTGRELKERAARVFGSDHDQTVVLDLFELETLLGMSPEHEQVALATLAEVDVLADRLLEEFPKATLFLGFDPVYREAKEHMARRRFLFAIDSLEVTKLELAIERKVQKAFRLCRNLQEMDEVTSLVTSPGSRHEVSRRLGLFTVELDRRRARKAAA